MPPALALALAVGRRALLADRLARREQAATFCRSRSRSRSPPRYTMRNALDALLGFAGRS
jgi:hypothetical protein